MIRRGIAAVALLLAAAECGAASRFGAAAAEAALVVEGRVESGPDEFGLTTFVPGRAARREAALGASLLVRLPRALPPGSSWLLMLVPDAMAASLGAWAPVDPEAGLVPLDGRAGRPDDVLAAADLAVNPPADPAALGERLVSLVGRGEAPTSHALEELLGHPGLLARHASRVGPILREALATRRVTPETAALAVRVLAAARERGDDVRFVDLVASEAPQVVVDAVVEALPSLATPATAEHLEHALGAATGAAIPGLLRLAGPAGARGLVPALCENASSTRPERRLAALASLAELRDPSCAGALRALALHEDPATSRAALSALSALGTSAP